MRLLSTALVAIILSSLQTAQAQTSVFVRNSTWLDYDVEVAQSGTFNMDPNQWVLGQSQLRGWIETTGEEVLTVNRTSLAVPEGDTAYFDIYLSSGSDYIILKLRVAGVTDGTTLAYSVEGNGFSEPWFDDGSFHEVNTVLGGKSVVIKFKPDNDDSQLGRDIRFAIHDLPVYEIPDSELQDANVLNVMYYNIQMISFGVSGMAQAAERGDLIGAQMSPNQDVVVFCEAFDDGPREDHLIPSMTAAGFIYRTEILNEPTGIIPFPVNGGVIVFSRWPIEMEDEIDFSLCGQSSSDCLSNKGVKYARINKLGKRYHVFGTHMDAGGDADDLLAKRQSYRELREFIAQLNIPMSEPVIYGGDFNTSPNHGDLYTDMLDSLATIRPLHLGFYESNFSDEVGRIIDHAWADKGYLLPLEVTNEVITVRSIDPILWDISEFSDHRCALGRFTYPDVSTNLMDTIICPGENLTLRVFSDINLEYRWFKNGVELQDQHSEELVLTDALESQSGHYVCQISYDMLYGNWNDTLTTLFYPNGPEQVAANIPLDFGEIIIDEVLCNVGVSEPEQRSFQVFPNPTNGSFTVAANTPLTSVPYRIMDACGRTVVTGNLNAEQTIDLIGASSGIYTIELRWKNNTVHQQVAVY